jgi:hypothetical protein
METVEHRTPELGALIAHALGDDQHHRSGKPRPREQRDSAYLRSAPVPRPVENASVPQPRAGIPGIQAALHLAPHPSERILAHHAGKQSTQRATLGTGNLSPLPPDPPSQTFGGGSQSNKGVVSNSFHCYAKFGFDFDAIAYRTNIGLRG